MVALVIAIHVPLAIGGMGWMGTYVHIEETVDPEFGGFFCSYMYAINSFVI